MFQIRITTLSRHPRTNIIGLCFIYMSSAVSDSGGDVTYDLLSVEAVGAMDGGTLLNLNYWIYAVLAKMLPCLLLTLFCCLLISAVRASQRRAVKLHAGNRRLKESNRTTVR